VNSFPFELGPIRPVDESDSLLIRTTRSCPWNRCSFCFVYKGMEFSIRSTDEIKKDIVAAADYYQNHPFQSCFLQDGDSFIMKTKELIEILRFLKLHFPSLKRISSYGRAQTMNKKSPGEIKEIFDAGLNTLYCGMESGSAAVLKNVKKGITPSGIITSALMAKTAGMKITEFIISGLGGQDLWQEHAMETARVLNEIDPHFIRVLTIGVKRGSELYKQMEKGDYRLQSEKDIIVEQRLMIENLEGITSHYANHHAIDLLIEARGQLPGDKPGLLAVMDRYLSLPENDQINFTLGRRLGCYQRLDDMLDENRRWYVESRVREIMAASPDQFDTIFHQLRKQVI